MSESVMETAHDDPAEGDGISTADPRTGSDDQSSVPTGGLRDGVLYFQRCRWCHTSVFRRLLCPACGSTDFAAERSGGIGVIRQVTLVGRSVGRPRAMAIIEMREGFRLRAKVSAEPLHRVQVGAQVRLGFGLRSQEIIFQLGHF
jgi:uncharacterized OB-fold protein